MEKRAREKTKYSRNETILKIGHLAKGIAHAEAIAFAKWLVGSKVKNVKNTRKSTLQEYWSYSVGKSARKNTKYSRNETILKIGHVAKIIARTKAIPFAKWSVWVKN